MFGCGESVGYNSWNNVRILWNTAQKWQLFCVYYFSPLFVCWHFKYFNVFQQTGDSLKHGLHSSLPVSNINRKLLVLALTTIGLYCVKMILNMVIIATTTKKTKKMTQNNVMWSFLQRLFLFLIHSINWNYTIRQHHQCQSLKSVMSSARVTYASKYFEIEWAQSNALVLGRQKVNIFREKFMFNSEIFFVWI